MEKKEKKEKAKKVIDDIFARIEELENKKNKVNEESREKYHEIINNLKNKKDDLVTKFDALQTATDDKLEEAGRVFSESAESFKEGFSKLSSLFKE